MNEKIDYSLMLTSIEDANIALMNAETSEPGDPTHYFLLQSIARSLHAIAVALTADHFGDEYPD